VPLELEVDAEDAELAVVPIALPVLEVDAALVVAVELVVVELVADAEPVVVTCVVAPPVDPELLVAVDAVELICAAKQKPSRQVSPPQQADGEPHDCSTPAQPASTAAGARLHAATAISIPGQTDRIRRGVMRSP
jgi:hypothetical protein